MTGGPSDRSDISETTNRDRTIDDGGIVRTQPALADNEPQVVAPGLRFGRYILLQQLGEGGMGVVYEALDPELARKVAIKFVHVQKGGSQQTGRSRAHAQLFLEAQTLAKLAHPNVVSIYDVGESGQHVYLAMELVEGHDLKDWLLEKKRHWREIVPVFIRAARGLAAAHRQGLVHRDFKPENVLLGADGRVCVADFGLANAGHGVSAPAQAKGERLDNTVVTMAGGQNRVAGTPSYMSPEQHRGEVLDPRSDIYSFCVSLYEALYGIKPFKGRGRHEILSAVELGNIQKPNRLRARRIPKRLRELVQAGLHKHRDDRPASVDVVIDELTQLIEPASTRRVSLSLVAGALIFGVGLPLAFPAESPLARCLAGQHQLDAKWNPSIATELKQHFVDTGIRHAPGIADKVIEQLTAYATSWQEGFAASCIERLSDDYVPVRADAFAGCLQIRADELSAAVEILQATQSKDVDRATDVVDALQSIESCADAEALERSQSLPRDPIARKLAMELEGKIAAGRLQLTAARQVEALEIAEDILREAPAAHYPPVKARAHLLAADILFSRFQAPAALEHLREAMLIAESTREDRLAAAVWMDYAYAIGYRMQKGADRAEELIEHSYAHLMRSEPTKLEHAIWQHRTMPVKSLSLGLAAMEPDVRRMIKVFDEQLGPTHQRTRAATFDLGYILEQQFRYDEAEELYRRLLQAQIEAHGTHHPTVVESMYRVALMLAAQSRLQEAAEVTKETITIIETLDISAAILFLQVYSFYAHDLANNNQFADASDAYLRCLDIHMEASGREDPELIISSMGVVNMTARAGRLQEAQKEATRLRRLVEISAAGGVTEMAVQSLFSLSGLSERTHKNVSERVALAKRAEEVYADLLPRFTVDFARRTYEVMFAKMFLDAGLPNKAREYLLGKEESEETKRELKKATFSGILVLDSEISQSLGDLKRARERAMWALDATQREFGERSLATFDARLRLFELDVAQKQWDDADARWLEISPMFLDIQRDAKIHVDALSLAGHVAAARGQRDVARARWEQALEILPAVEYPAKHQEEELRRQLASVSQ